MTDQDIKELFKFAKNRTNTIYKNPVHTYHNFVNVFCLVHHDIKRQEAVNEAHKTWTKAKNQNKNCDQSPVVLDIYSAGITRMRKIKEKPNILLAFLNTKKVGLMITGK